MKHFLEKFATDCERVKFFHNVHGDFCCIKYSDYFDDIYETFSIIIKSLDSTHSCITVSKRKYLSDFTVEGTVEEVKNFLIYHSEWKISELGLEEVTY